MPRWSSLRTTSARRTLRAGGRDHHRHVPENLGEGRAVRDGSDDQHRLDAQVLERPDRPAVDPRSRGGPRGLDRTDQQRAEALVLEHLAGPLDHVDQQRVPQVGDQTPMVLDRTLDNERAARFIR
jgi:hypothetical protein